ncbi:hypothetical protein HMPREF1982_04083 [Clostridiales bacterium oral taxon 876 str. F0540]|nr:hypothetical protein HMPREF1982_04083 [Clostridiales bacterium oral taxon 876 str. F0540]
MSQIKIRISEKAYEKLLNVLTDCPEFSHIRLKYKDGCCGSSKLDILLDNYNLNDIEEIIDKLPILYDNEVLENIKEITIVYRNQSLMIKTILNKEPIKDCGSCEKGGSCSHKCGHNKKMA